MLWFVFFALIFCCSWLVTGLVRRYALARSWFDIPNSRSAHQLPTPRGGGLSFVCCFLLAVFFLMYLNCVPVCLAVTLIVTGTCVAFLGYLDDCWSLSAKWRLLGHFVASGFAVYTLSDLPIFAFLHENIFFYIISFIFGSFYLVWLLNLYNFMDGIDGLAAIEALSVCLGSLILYYLQQGDINFLLAALASAVGGFLFWNFPRARIFMGDVGSSFLGITLGVLSIDAAQINIHFFWSWLTLLGVFIVDSTITLLRRGLQRDNLFQAHCSHAYQYASRYYGKHLPVTLAVLVINWLWLFPISLIIGLGVIHGAVGLVIAYVPLILIAFKFNAGKRLI